MGVRRWSDEQIEDLVRLCNEGVPHDEVGRRIGKSGHAVRQYVSLNGKKLGIVPRKVRVRTQAPRRKLNTEFDKAWHGNVPYGHWMITKPWGKPTDAQRC